MYELISTLQCVSWCLVLLWCSFCYGSNVNSMDIEPDTMKFCSFFNNRKPSPQPGLRNCTWFRENSCCKQEEIEATFGTVKPLPGSSPDCQRYTNSLMCYICAPYQNTFYRQEKLTVCEEFCNAWYSACSSAILKGSLVGDLYTNGREFCLKRNFKCEPFLNYNCFIDTHLRGVSKGSSVSVPIITMTIVYLMAALFYTHVNYVS